VPNLAFEQIVNNFGGTFNWGGVVAGVLSPTNVLGSLGTNNNVIPPLSYFWYGCRGIVGTCTPIEPYLEFNNDYFGFIYCAPGTNGGRVITNSDQDWVNQSTSLPLMENTLTNLSNTGYVCFSTSGSLFLGNDTTICTGQNLLLDAQNPGSTYTWSTGEITQTITVNAAGSYWVEVDNGTCVFSDTILIDEYTPIIPDLGNDTTVCINQPLELDAGIPGANYLWSTGETTQSISINTSGTYWVEVGPAACVSADSISVTFSTILPIDLGNDTTVCANAPFTIEAGVSGLTYLWSTGEVSQSIQVTASGDYWVIANNAGCEGTDTISIDLFIPPVIDLGNDISGCPGSEIEIIASGSFESYAWSTGSSSSTITIDTPGEIILEVTDSNGCKASDTIIFFNFTVALFSSGMTR
jgi:hypothetical protein